MATYRMAPSKRNAGKDGLPNFAVSTSFPGCVLEARGSAGGEVRSAAELCVALPRGSLPAAVASCAMKQALQTLLQALLWGISF